MRVYRSLAGCEGFGPCAITIGNFDGVHAGHREILRRVAKLASERDWSSAVLTFDPHPTRVVAPQRAPRLLTTTDERCVHMAAEKIQNALILPFTPEVARLEPEQFVRQVLVEKLEARAVLVGQNFRFGAKQAGNTALLAELGARYGFATEIVPPIHCRGRLVSSSEVRRLVESGCVSLAGRLLERPHALAGRVVTGHGVGAKQTVPTLNLETGAEVLPARGVYITRTHDAERSRSWPSISNIGFRPTFGGDERLSIETFLLAPLEGEAPREIRVEFLRRVREERKFESPEALKAQILRDAGRAVDYHRRFRRWSV